MGNGNDVLLAMTIAIIVVLIALVLSQWLIEMKYPKYWYALPSLWFLFILLNSLLSFFLQSHKGQGIGTYLGFFAGILVYSSPALFPIAVHFFMERKRKITESTDE